MKIIGFQSGHDVSYCVLENGVPVVHEELERFLRLKEPGGDGLELFFNNHKDFSDVKHFAFGNYGSRTAYWAKRARFSPLIEEYDDKMKSVLKDSGGEFYEIGHHLSHAANAFFTSPYDDALVITIDGGGNEPDLTNSNNEYVSVAATLNIGEGNKIKPIHYWDDQKFNFGRLWSNFTGKIFGLSTGYPKGHQAGSVMAMATIGNPKYIDMIDLSMGTDMSEKNYQSTKRIVDLFRADYENALRLVSSQNPSLTKEQIEQFVKNFENTKFEEFYELKKIASLSEQDAFDVAASLQKFTESEFKKMLDPFMQQHMPKNVCFSGGVSLNCVMLGKFKEWYPYVENIFCDPVPYDGGLSLGSARYVWHHILDNPRIDTPQNRSPYLGVTYSKDSVLEAIKERSGELVVDNLEDDNPVLDILEKQQIIAVFGGGSESGRRALGNRSILVDPRSPTMKDTLNERVKHRQWYRPFAPSILKEDAPSWFENFVDSPYMSVALQFKKEKQSLVPAVVHADGTGRLQTVDKELNPWYHGFISQWKERTGVPILLNTSFNDREPIVEKPEHAIDCFLRTNIDYLYFFDYNLLLSKTGKGDK